MTLTNRTPELAASGDALARARGGDLVAFAELMRNHETRVFSIGLRFTGRRADAEEITQDVFVQLHDNIAHLQDAVHLKRWLLRTATNRCLNRLRDERRRPRLVPIETLPADFEPRATEQQTDPLISARLRELLLELSPEARAVVLLRYQEDLDPSEIATVLEMPVSTVKSHLRRSLEWLRARFPGDSHEP
jgi:RNA polymerase sigma-70 factor (ECF subfamily)